ncbi:MAG TPA: aldolase/citrate lyase family protein [Woeseiaceae bacterium]|nr:aldolase/citrate lyase family protein [Woeseiaceae bacterium]
MSKNLHNRFRRGLESGRTQFGLWLGIPDNSIAEMMACAGFDWLLIDHEHGPYELRDVMASLQAMSAYDVAPIVRPANGDTALLKKLCDIGVQSFLVPMIDTVDAARAVVEAVKYPPKGRRGLGTSMARAARWNTVPDYVNRANDEICVIVQAESVAAIENLELIAKVDGVDGVFIGPSDLSASMGHAGNILHPDVVETVSSALRTIRSASKHAGLLCLDPDKVPHFIDCGANFVGVGVDTLLIGNAARSLAAQYRSDDENAPGNVGY